MKTIKFAHQTEENPLCSRHVWVCAECGWWKTKPFDCRHTVIGEDGDIAFRDIRADRCSFHLGSPSTCGK